MYKFIQKNQKKMLAVFGVLLMIVFILPQSTKSGLGRGDHIIGTVGNTKIDAVDVQSAKEELRFLAQNGFAPLMRLGSGFAYAQFQAHPELYVMLQHEARQQGIRISPEQANLVIRETFEDQSALSPEDHDKTAPEAVAHFLLVQTAFERAASTVKVSKPLLDHLLAEEEQAIKLNLVEFSADEFKDSVPAPTPEQVRQHFDKYADLLLGSHPAGTQPVNFGYRVPDRVKLQYLELPREAVLASVLASLSPNDRYDLDKQAYLYYINPKNAEEFAAPPAPATTQASTLPSQPSSHPSTLGTQAAATTSPAGPTTKPFEEARDDLRKRLLLGDVPNTSEVVKRVQAQFAATDARLRAELHSRLAGDYVAYAAAHPTTRPTTTPAADAPETAPATNPTTGPAVAYDDLAYLQAVADEFEGRYTVRPLVNSVANDWLTREDLAKLPGIGTASAGHASFASDSPFAGATFASVAIRVVHPPATAPTTMASTGPSTTPATSGPSVASRPATAPADDRGALALWQPSDTFQDGDGNAYVFRVTAFDPDHKPALEEVELAIVKDLRAAAAYDLAAREAKRLMDSATVEASISGHAALAAAARGIGRTPIVAGPFRPSFESFQQPIPGYPMPPGAFSDRFTFLRVAQALAQKASPHDPHPMSLIEFRDARKILVAEVAGFELPWPQEDDYRARLELTQIAEQNLQLGLPTLERQQFARKLGPAAQQALQQSLVHEWFDYDSATARLKFVSSDKASGAGKK